MIPRIAWRNIFRSKLRSFALMGAITIGVWAVLIIVSLTQGMVESYIDTAVRNEISHVQIHRPEFKEDKEAKYLIEEPGEIINSVDTAESVKAAASRLVANAMVSTSRGVRGAILKGVDPQRESELTWGESKLDEGNYLDSAGRSDPVVISASLAEKLDLEVGKKLVATITGPEGDMVSAAFRVSGLYSTSNSQFDLMHVFVRRADLADAMGFQDGAHEIAIRLSSSDEVESFAEKLKKAHPDLLVETFTELAPDVALFKTQSKSMSYIVIAIFMFALVFGIINTMLMAVLERVKELGMLMAIGMNRWRVFSMVVMETVFLAAMALPIGLGIGWLSIEGLAQNGIDLSAWSEGMRQYGLTSTLYPALDTGLYYQLGMAVVLTAVIGSIYPAFKAIRLKPVEAVRAI